MTQPTRWGRWTTKSSEGSSGVDSTADSRDVPSAAVSSPVDDAALHAFAASMPPSYRRSFDGAAMRAHAIIVARRGDRATHVERWRTETDGVTVLCVVADDRPGLLSRITEALVVHALDVVSAHAYSRASSSGASEAVDFLCVRKLLGEEDAPSFGLLDDADVARVRETVDELVRGTNIAAPPRTKRRVRPTPSSTGAAIVRFETNELDGTTILTVEAIDRPGLLLAVTQTLFRADVQITGLRARTEAGRARDRLVLAERDGKPLSAERRLALQISIFAALDERLDAG